MESMRILLCHNRYQQLGGEDSVFAAEGELLRRHGHGVAQFTEDNRRINGMSRLSLAANAVWSNRSRRKLTDMLSGTGPDVVHFQNTFPLISPSAYYACRAAGVGVVQTLQNYRLVCPAAILHRAGRPCEDCVGRFVPWPGIVHACYRRSRPATATVAAMLTAHRLLGTWARTVDVYVALTEFARQKFIDGGLPEEKIVVKPNCLDNDPGVGDHGEGYALFVGRLVPVKGIATLVRAWDKLKPGVGLKIVGSGPLESLASQSPHGIEWLGQQPKKRVFALMQRASFLIFPSEWYEGFPMTLAEAFATGLPVIVSKIGAMAEIVEDGRTGLHFKPGYADDLAEKVEWALSHPQEMAEIGKQVRRAFETRYTPDQNYEMLMRIYQLAIDRARKRA